MLRLRMVGEQEQARATEEKFELASLALHCRVAVRWLSIRKQRPSGSAGSSELTHAPSAQARRLCRTHLRAKYTDEAVALAEFSLHWDRCSASPVAFPARARPPATHIHLELARLASERKMSSRLGGGGGGDGGAGVAKLVNRRARSPAPDGFQPQQASRVSRARRPAVERLIARARLADCAPGQRRPLVAAAQCNSRSQRQQVVELSARRAGSGAQATPQQ